MTKQRTARKSTKQQPAIERSPIDWLAIVAKAAEARAEMLKEQAAGASK